MKRVPSELTDVVIRIMDICEYYRIDLEAILLEKHKYNKKRQIEHAIRDFSRLIYTVWHKFHGSNREGTEVQIVTYLNKIRQIKIIFTNKSSHQFRITFRIWWLFSTLIFS